MEQQRLGGSGRDENIYARGAPILGRRVHGVGAAGERNFAIGEEARDASAISGLGEADKLLAEQEWV